MSLLRGKLTFEKGVGLASSAVSFRWEGRQVQRGLALLLLLQMPTERWKNPGADGVVFPLTIFAFPSENALQTPPQSPLGSTPLQSSLSYALLHDVQRNFHTTLAHGRRGPRR